MRPPDRSNPWKTLASRIPFENPWIRVVQNDVVTPSGGEGEYTVVEFKNRAVAVIPIDDEDHTWLVGQYRFAIGSYEWEIPEGGAPVGEEVLSCARRELAEETGLRARQWDVLIDGMQLSNSVTTELGYTFVARGLTQQAATPEETERLELRRLPLEQAFELALDGTIRDTFSLVSLFKLQQLRQLGHFGGSL